MNLVISSVVQRNSTGTIWPQYSTQIQGNRVPEAKLFKLERNYYELLPVPVVDIWSKFPQPRILVIYIQNNHLFQHLLIYEIATWDLQIPKPAQCVRVLMEYQPNMSRRSEILNRIRYPVLRRSFRSTYRNTT